MNNNPPRRRRPRGPAKIDAETIRGLSIGDTVRVLPPIGREKQFPAIIRKVARFAQHWPGSRVYVVMEGENIGHPINSCRKVLA